MLGLNRGEFQGIASLWVIFFGMVASNQMTRPFLGLYALESGASILVVGIVYAAHPFASFLTRIPGATLSNKYGTRAIIAIGLTLNGLGTILYSVSRSPSVMVAAALLQGVGFGFFHPSMLSVMVQSRFGKLRQEESVAYISTSVAAGQTLGPAIGSLMILTGYPTLFYAGGFASLAPVLISRLIREEPGATRYKDGGKARWRELLTKDFTVFLFSRTVYSYVQGTILAFLPLLAADRFQMSKTEIGILFAVAALCNFVARPISGQLAFRVGEKILIVLGSALMTLTALIYSFAYTPSLLWPAAVLYGLSLGLFVPPSIMRVGKSFLPETRTMGLAFFTIMIDIGFSLGSAVSAGIFELTDYFMVFAVAGLIGVFGTGAAAAKLEGSSTPKDAPGKPSPS